MVKPIYILIILLAVFLIGIYFISQFTSYVVLSNSPIKFLGCGCKNFSSGQIIETDCKVNCSLISNQ